MEDLQSGKLYDLDMVNLQDYGSGQSVITNNNTTLVVDHNGKFNARNFNGTNTSILADSPLLPLGSKTISFWIKPDNITTFQIFMDNDGGGQGLRGGVRGYFNLGTFGITTRGTSSNTAVFNLTYTGMSIGNWYHVTSVQNGTVDAKLYINGVLVSTDTGAGETETLGTYNFGLGRDVKNTPSYWFDGQLSDAKVWNRDLSAEEVIQVYQDVKGNYQGLFDGCVGYWDMKNDAKDIISDNDGTVTGATLTTDHLGVEDSAYDFTTNQIVELGTDVFASNNTGTIEGWIKLDSAGMGTTRDVFSTTSKTNVYPVFNLRIHTTNKLFKIFRTASNTLLGGNTGATALSADTWYHVGLTCDGTNGVFYLNGVSDGWYPGIVSDVAPYWFNDSLTTGVTYAIGAAHNGTTSIVNPLNGTVGQMKVWDRALTADEFKSIYDLTKSKYIHPYVQNGGEQ